ncbi:MAG: DNA recombination/repair protein RecA, partial [Victivallales bacterium]|nr:DNA recombination/repair protein RecA [Victivallales bacterium]
AIVAKTNTCVIFTNQIREKIGVMFGNPENTTGGRALKFYASIRLDIRRIATIKGADGVAAGSRVKVKVVKNKLAPPFMECEFDIMYAEGISRAGSLLDVAIDMGILEKRGSWFAMNDVQIAQGREQTKLAIQNDLELQKAIETEINARRETCELAMPHDDAESEEDLVEDEEEAAELA